MLLQLLESIPRAKVLVVGDAMLDRYWYGGVDRISPEAPVPVVAVNGSDERLGGAANVARNVTALGAGCSLFSICGDDSAGNSLEQLLQQSHISAKLFRDKLINTTVKLRVISHNQQLLRIDFESPASKDARVALLDHYLEQVQNFNVVVISDYGKGGLGHIQEMITAAKAKSIPVVIDPKGDDYSGYHGASLITPNRKEFEHVAGKFRDNADLEERARTMVDALELDGILITRGEEGMSLVERNGQVLHMPAKALEVYDVTGAGDTVIATIGAAYAVGGQPEDALHLANIAAGVVVGKLGAATAGPDEIKKALNREEG